MKSQTLTMALSLLLPSQGLAACGGGGGPVSSTIDIAPGAIGEATFAVTNGSVQLDDAYFGIESVVVRGTRPEPDVVMSPPVVGLARDREARGRRKDRTN